MSNIKKFIEEYEHLYEKQRARKGFVPQTVLRDTMLAVMEQEASEDFDRDFIIFVDNYMNNEKL
jgi:hypothetical protein